MAEPEKIYPGLLHPLSMMRRARGLPSLEHEVLEPGALPQPYQQMLVHEGDMTSRLERCLPFINQSKEVAFFQRRQKLFSGSYSGNHRIKPKTCGIWGDRNSIKSIVGASQGSSDCRPNASGCDSQPGTDSLCLFLAWFFTIIPDEALKGAFAIDIDRPLFGRSNRIETRTGETIAQIVEILPPV